MFQRPDIKSVRYHNHHLFTVPSKIFDHPIEEYTDPNLNIRMPFYFELEQKVKHWSGIVRNTPYLREKEELEREQNE